MNKIITASLLFILGSLMTLLSTNVYAAQCKLDSAESILNITDNITLNPATTGVAGTVLWSKTYTIPNLKYSCAEGTGSTWHSTFSRSYLSTSIENVFETEITGIGIRVKWPSNDSGGWLPGDSGTPTSCTHGCSINNTTVLVEFVQTGKLNQGESYIPLGDLAVVNIIPTTDASERLRIMTIKLGSAIRVLTRSCSIYPSSNNVDLGTYSLASFTNDTSFQGDKKQFTITVACPVTTNISLSFASVNKIPFGSLAGVIGTEEGEGYASNFGIRLYEKKSQYMSNALKMTTEYPYTVTDILVNTYEAQIYVPTSVDRTGSLTAGKIVGAVQYTMIIK